MEILQWLFSLYYVHAVTDVNSRLIRHIDISPLLVDVFSTYFFSVLKRMEKDRKIKWAKL